MSQSIQFLKLLLTTALFGASSGLLDGYFAALKWPLLLQGVLIGALISGSIPTAQHFRSLHQHGTVEAVIRVSIVISVGLLGSIFMVGYFYSAEIIQWTLPGFSEHQATEAALYLPWCLATVGLIGVSELLAAFYMMNRRFASVALLPAFCLALSLAYLVIFQDQGVIALVHGAAFAAGFQLLLTMILARRYGGFRLRPGPFSRAAFVGMFSPVLLMIPVLFLAYMTLIADLYFLSHLAPGSVSTLEFSLRLHETMIRLTVISLAGALFPVLGSLIASGQSGAVSHQMTKSLNAAILVFLPLAAGILLFSPFVLAAVFERGRFTPSDTIMVSLLWGLFSFSLVPMAMVHVTARALQAHRAFVFLLYIGIALITSHLIVLGIGTPTLGMAAIPLAHFISQTLAAALSLWALARMNRGAETHHKKSVILTRSLIYAGIYIASLYAVSRVMELSMFDWNSVPIPSTSHKYLNLLITVVAVVIPSLIYLRILSRTNTPGLEILGALGRRRNPTHKTSGPPQAT